MKAMNTAERRLKHLNQLLPIIGCAPDEIKVIYKQLKDLEHKGHKAAEDYCNLANFEISPILDDIKLRLKILIKNGDTLKNIHLNTDPRGYFLKLSDDYMRANKIEMYRDWGGYGIFCPMDDSL